LLRHIDRHVSFYFVREKLTDFYSDTVSPSVDPEILLRILLIVACSAKFAQNRV
jgi:hypothetical protein